MNQEALQVAKESMKDNRKLLTALGNEKPIHLTLAPKEEKILSSVLDLLPKSTEGKLVLASLVAFVAWELRNKDRK
ncbi:hypothetical protein [Candidatus Nitrosotalea okcheonensis]|uniref:Uncharacterized protein n=1 Tax=Candidatus Nitrosotalea okcheonensis TaxID=1903276 RepID=A0A2H1FFL9_9ARCH|nr:hypothetical protein [Candidatus Nitrosotalea okcheonensis]SMH71560.1 protein of unknown function [Candidatus Nitrosotalea okcheonensis]